jgi:hypothetical protein
MEFLIFLVVLVAVLFWVKKQFPNAEFTKYLNIFSKHSKPLDNAPQSAAQVSTPAHNNEDKNLKPESAISTLPCPAALQDMPTEATFEHAAPVTTMTSQIPEDSVLKRHYLANLAAERTAITHPYPTDSVLRRHYESLQASYLQKV